MKLFIPENRRRGGALWLVIFSDLSTNLMLFFLILFAMTRMSAAERETVIEGMQRATSNQAALEERALKKQKEKNAIRTLEDTIAYGRLKKYTNLSVGDDKIKLTIELPFFFATGSAEINAAARPALKSLVIPIKEFPNDIIIEGHTDNVPMTAGHRYGSNWELSVARAVSVINFFKEKGVNPAKLVSGGYGEYHPAFPNDTPRNRAKNRRIEITILRQPAV